MGHHRHLLELTSRALCGTDPARRDEYAAHLTATERRFYEEPEAGVEDLMEWNRVHAGLSAWGRALLTDMPGDETYPIVATVFALMSRRSPARRTAAALEFFQWSLDKGGILAVELGYVSLPIPLVKQIKRTWIEHYRFGT